MPPTMDCGVCRQPLTSRRKPLCVSCSQATLHQPRIAHAASLLSREQWRTHVEAVLRPGNAGIIAALSEDADWDAIKAGITADGLKRSDAERMLSEDKIVGIIEKSKSLRTMVKEYRSLMQERKESHERRRRWLDTETKHLEAHRVRALEPAQLAIKKMQGRLDKVHSRTAEAREYLCREAAHLYGLKRTKHHDGTSTYFLGDLPIPNLKDLNGFGNRLTLNAAVTVGGNLPVAAAFEVISASLNNVCLFLGLCCRYLSVKLPAEIVPAHHGSPRAALLQPSASYKAPQLQYPTSATRPTASSNHTRVSGAHSDEPKLRTVNLDRPLPQLLKENSKAHGLFCEAAMLLAYDIAWLARIQGSQKVPGFTDLCAIGSNIHHLFVGRVSSQIFDTSGKRDSSAKTPTASPSRQPAASPGTSQGPGFGVYSHASAYYSLSSHLGNALFAPEAWSVSVAQNADALKKYLRQEASRSEWHFIDDKEWDDELEHEKAVLVGGTMRDRGAGALSVITVKPSDGPPDDNVEADADARSRAKAGGGGRWMKMNGRSEGKETQ